MNKNLKNKLTVFFVGIGLVTSFNVNSQISNQEIRIGFSTDLSGLYSTTALIGTTIT
jgi:hypothetical protein